MSHNYLFDIYTYIDRRLAEVEPDLTRPDADENARQNSAGRIDLLCEFERFINQNFDVKLPKRLRRQRSEAPAVCKRTGLNPS